MEDKKELVIKENGNNLTASPSPAAMMQLAMEKNLDLEKVEKMIELQAKWDKMEAEKAYTQAMAAFKKSPPKVLKDRKVEFATSKGNTSYTHATLGNVTNTVCTALAKHGFSAEWETNQVDGEIEVTCTLTHKKGHSKSTTLKASPDVSGNKNSIQAIGSTVTYLERYTLLARCGLATHDQDVDGVIEEEIIFVDKKQINTIRDMLAATGSNEERFLKWVHVDSIEKIPEDKYDIVIGKLERIQKKQEKDQ